MTTRSPWWPGLALGSCILCLIVGLGGQYGRWSNQADLINFAAPAWAATGLLCAALVLIMPSPLYQRIVAGGAIAALTLLLITLTPPGVRTRGGTDCGQVPLRLIQFNIFKDNPDVGPALAWIRNSQADIVVLEEATEQLNVVPILLRDFPYAVGCADHLRCSTVILSRRPFLASGGLARGDPENRKALSAAWATIASPAGPFTIVGAHLSRPWPWRGDVTERDDLVRFVGQLDSGTTLVAGDFNLPTRTFQLRQLAERFRLGVAPDIRSWPARQKGPPLWGIDHLFAGHRWLLARIQRGPLLGSDHYPLLADLKLTVPCRR